MNDGTPARDFLLPRLNAMMQDAAERGISRDVAVAVLIDLVTGPGFNDTPIDPAEDVPSHDTGSYPIETSEAARAYAEAIPNDTTGGTQAGLGRGRGRSRLTLT